MSINQYGIYLAYPPTVDLRHQGLGRYLAAFLKGAESRDDTSFVLVCPSWSKKDLERLFHAEGVASGSFHIISPKRTPVLLRLYQYWLARQAKKTPTPRLKRLVVLLEKAKNAYIDYALRKLTTSDTFFSFTFRLLPVTALLLVALIAAPIWIVLRISVIAVRYLHSRWGRRFIRIIKRLQRTMRDPKNDGLVVRLYRVMEDNESDKMLSLIRGLPNVQAWYCPTAFWPAFNKIEAPRLMCVPDVVPVEFPTAFAELGNDRNVQAFHDVETSILRGRHFVTYSEHVKWNTLVNKYAISPENVTVIRHAPNNLSSWININDPSKEYATAISDSYCRSLLLGAIQTSRMDSYTRFFENGTLRFLFYASQLRPNKNVITLLRAYEYLLRKRFISHKLILTGNQSSVPSVKKFIAERHLQKDVLFLKELSTNELAACYKLAELAVNPSLSEGGCPFTFTEALSVNTPVVMARIPVTEEVLDDPETQDLTLFDPYNWKDMADKIEWALNHRDQLLSAQTKIYVELSKRSWSDVVNEHIDALQRISTVHVT